MKRQDLTEGNLLSVLCMFAIPFLMANILQSLYGAVDLFVVGKYCDARSVAAVSTGTQVTQIVTSLSSGLTLGSTIMIGNYMGQKNYEMVKKAIGTTLTVFSVFSLALTGLMLFFEASLLTILNTPEESFGLTMTYVAICAWGNFFICGYNSISAILRGYGDSKKPMIFVAIACILNIILDFVLVCFCNMGVAGTALATVISQGASMGIAVADLKRNGFLFDFKPSSFRVHKELAKELASVGIPISFQEFMIRISFLYLMTVMNSCGVSAASVVGIGSKYDVFAMLTATSMANALAAVTAQNIGAGKPERARKALWYGMSFAVGVSVLFWFWAQISPETMIGVFTKNQEIIAAGVPFFRSCSYDYIMVAMVFCLNGYLNGRAKTVWTMISSSVGALVLRIPMVYLFGRYFAYDLGMLGKIAPIVSGIMAAYTLLYVLYEGRKSGESEKRTVSDRRSGEAVPHQRRNA